MAWTSCGCFNCTGKPPGVDDVTQFCVEEAAFEFVHHYEALSRSRRGQAAAGEQAGPDLVAEAMAKAREELGRVAG